MRILTAYLLTVAVLLGAILSPGSPAPLTSNGTQTVQHAILQKIELFNLEGQLVGTGCPIEPFRLLTAYHVGDKVSHWVDRHGKVHPIRMTIANKGRDITWMISEEPFPFVHRRAMNDPIPFDTLYVPGWIQPGWKPVAWRGYMVGEDGDGDFQFDSFIAEGTSGSCVMNEQAEVVGIATSSNTWGRVNREVGGYFQRASACFVPISGKWLDKVLH